MSEAIEVGILTIGTEVVQGQIINTNAAWLANELTNLRFDARWHLTVADQKRDMLDALNFLSQRVKIMVVTGGLGPTSDDFTRDVIAEWASQALRFDKDSWEHIRQRYSLLGTEPPESNRQQCFFPESAKILQNARGTAHGFFLNTAHCDVYVLPGPPEEIKGIWKDHLEASLAKISQNTDVPVLKRWQCLGISESALGEIVEDAIKGSSLLAGYRPVAPYVEIKIWCKASLLKQEASTLEKLDTVLSKWTVSRDDEDIVQGLFQALAQHDDIEIEDCASLGAIGQRLGLKWQDDNRTRLRISNHFAAGLNVQDIRGPNKVQLSISSLAEDGSWTVGIKTAHLQKEMTLKLPFKRHPERWTRERLFVCEQSLAAFLHMCSKGERLA